MTPTKTGSKTSLLQRDCPRYAIVTPVQTRCSRQDARLLVRGCAVLDGNLTVRSDLHDISRATASEAELWRMRSTSRATYRSSRCEVRYAYDGLR